MKQMQLDLNSFSLGKLVTFQQDQKSNNVSMNEETDVA